MKLPEPYTFFVDRPLGGKVIVGALREAGIRVEAGDAHFAPGDADLSVTGLQLDGAPLVVGRDPQAASSVVPPATEQPLKVPTIRVCGTTPDRADIETLIDELVAEFFNATSTRAPVAQLPVARWQETAKRIVRHERFEAGQRLRVDCRREPRRGSARIGVCRRPFDAVSRRVGRQLLVTSAPRKTPQPQSRNLRLRASVHIEL